ncbi:hypothetical protein [Petrachloros mirabilis]
MSLTQDCPPGASGLREASLYQYHCLLCHRVRLVYENPQKLTGWEQMANVSNHSRLRCPEFPVIDTYCDGCTVYYHQLMTYGKAYATPTPEESTPDGNLAG